MTSFAFILGVVPLVVSEGAGAENETRQRVVVAPIRPDARDRIAHRRRSPEEKIGVLRQPQPQRVGWMIDEDFLNALEHGLPTCAGIALGFDRLVVLATGAEDIEEVLWAPVR